MLAPHLSVAGTVPSIPLLVVITIAFLEGSATGATVGFAAGLALDLLGTGPVGSWALVLTVAGYVSGMLQQNVFAAGWLQPVTVAAIAGLLAETVYLVVLIVLGVGPGFLESIVSVVLPRAVYNTLLVMLVYPWLARFMRSDRPVKSFRRLA
jgi:rod shape-determining protein MreD